MGCRSWAVRGARWCIVTGYPRHGHVHPHGHDPLALLNYCRFERQLVLQAIWACIVERSLTREGREGMSDRQDERRPETSLQARREGPTSGKKVWFITGAGRGMGVDIAKAALAAGNAVVATGRTIDVASLAVGQAEDLLVVKLDVTSRADAEAAVRAAVERF